MKLLLNTTLALCVLASAAFVFAAESDDKPKQSPELKVLDHFAGTWKSVVTGKIGDKSYTETDFVMRTWSTDGQFLLEQARFQQNSDVSRSRGAWTYDPASKSYRMVLMTRNMAILSNGQWNEATRTMTIRFTDHTGNVGISTHRFIDKGHAEWSAVMKDANGTVVWQGSCKQTRVIGHPRKPQ